LLLLYRFVEPKDKFYTSGVCFLFLIWGLAQNLFRFSSESPAEGRDIIDTNVTLKL